MSVNFDSIPENWTIATIGDLLLPNGQFIDGDWVESKDQDPNGDVRLIQLADVGDGYYVNRSSRFLTSIKASELQCTFLEPGDVLVARMPDPLGRACIFPGDEKLSVTVVDVCIVRTGLGDENHRWLMWTINASGFRNEIAGLQSGSTRGRISRRNLASISLPVPPLDEQRRIVAEIEKQFARLEECTAALRRVAEDLRQYRASVLKTACEGRLVPTEAELARAEGRDYEPASVLLERILAERRARWEADQLARMKAQGKAPKDDSWKLQYEEPEEPATGNLPVLPEGWVWASLEQLPSSSPNSITDGPFGSNLKTLHYTSTGPRVIRLQNVGDGVFIDEFAHISDEHFEKLRKHEVKVGDIVIAALGENPPRSCIIPKHVGAAIVKADCIRFEPHNELDRAFLNYCLNAHPTRLRTKATMHGVGRPRLNLTEIKSIVLPIAPFPEQRRIVAEVQRRLHVADELEELVSVNLERADELRRAILKRAFEGRLVPQDPNDEPASVLLERIAAERERRTEEAMTQKKSPSDKRRKKSPDAESATPLFPEERVAAQSRELVTAFTTSATPLFPEERVAAQSRKLLTAFTTKEELTVEDLFRHGGYDFDSERDIDSFFGKLTKELESVRLTLERTSNDDVVIKRGAA